MRLPYLTLLSVHCCLFAPYIFSSEATHQPADAKSAIERSLPFVEKGGVAWMTERKCASCHHVPFMIWSHNEARARGIAVDSTKLDGWANWAANESLNSRAFYKLPEKFYDVLCEDCVADTTLAKLKPLVDKPFVSEQEMIAALAKALTTYELKQHQPLLMSQAQQKKDGRNDGGGLDHVSQLLAGRADRTEKVKEFAAAGPQVLAKWQEKDGSWKTAGQFPGQNRPLPESNAVATCWAAFAISTVENPTEESKIALERALVRVKEYKPGKSTESLIVGILTAQKFGTPEQGALAIEELKKHQNEDGGWGWLLGMPSDAFATGQALYALGYAGPSGNDAATMRAEKYLLATQGEDGSWTVPTDAIAKPGTKPDRLKRLEMVYRYWGTAWAVIGLSRRLPVK